VAGPVRPHWPPYIAGFVLGLVVILTFVLVGNGVGASGVFARIAAYLGMSIAPEATAHNSYFAGMVAKGANPLASWIVIEVLGVAIGALLAAVNAGRFRLQLDGTGKIRTHSRIVLALFGGILAGFGSRIAAGCTSGLGLSGGAMLSIGGMLFLLTFFASGLLMSRILRRVW
jgi:uncharacterized membrane protein YedE/YeeE